VLPAITKRVLAALFLIALGAGVRAEAPAAPAAPSAATQRAPGPLQSRFRAEKLVVSAAGETLEDGSSVSVGDIVQYSAEHKNVSARRLLNVEFAIPVPAGTTYVDGSAQPETAVPVRLAGGTQQVRWRVAAIEPGETVILRLRVRIDPDPLLKPAPARPQRPELRRQP